MAATCNSFIAHSGRRAAGRSGLTLVEVLVAVVVLAIVVIGTAAFLAHGRGAVECAAQRRTATQVANERKEMARSAGYAALADGSGLTTVDGVQYNWTVEVTVAQADPGDAGSFYKRLVITVDWPTSGSDPVVLSSALGPGGI